MGKIQYISVSAWATLIAFDSKGYMRKYKKLLKIVKNAKGTF